MLGDGENMDGDQREGQQISITVLSSLPEGEPQGSFLVQIPTTATGGEVLRLVCKQAKVPLHPSYVLMTGDGVRLPMDRQVASITSIQEGKNLLWNSLGW